MTQIKYTPIMNPLHAFPCIEKNVVAAPNGFKRMINDALASCLNPLSQRVEQLENSIDKETHKTTTEESKISRIDCKPDVCDKSGFDIPIWHRYTLTIEEAAGYYHIGEGKLRMLIDRNPCEDFYVMNGNRVLIKREKFERYLDQVTAL